MAAKGSQDALGRIAGRGVRVGYIRRGVVVVALCLVVAGQAVGALFFPVASLISWMSGSANMGGAVLASAVTVGSIFAFIGIKKDPEDSTYEMTVQLAPDAPLATPDGWTESGGGAGSGGKPTPPSTGAPPVAGFNDCAGCQDMFLACQNRAAQFFVPAESASWLNGIENGTAQCFTTGHSFVSNLGFTLVCAAGYTNSGGTCTLSNANLVIKPSDGTCGIRRTGNSYAYDTLDPDCNTPGSQVQISGGDVTVTGSDGTKAKVTTNPSTGSTTINNYTPNYTTNTTTISSVNASAPGAAGIGNNVKVTGTGTQTVAGTGDLAGTPEDSQLCGGPGQPACSTKIDETGTPATADYSAETTALNEAATAREGVITGTGSAPVGSLGGFGWGGPTLPMCGCTPFSLSIKGWTGGYDWCVWLGQARDWLGWFFVVLGGIYIWRRGTSLTGGK